MKADTTNLAVEYVTPTKLRTHPDNPRRGDIGAIYTSMKHHGVYTPVIAQRSTGHILVGNHRYLAMLEAGLTEIPVIWRDVDDETGIKIMLADNRSSDIATNDNRTILDLLMAMDSMDGTLYDDDDADNLRDLIEQEGHGLDRIMEEYGETDDEARAPTTGELLQVVDVTMAEPRQAVTAHEVWHIGRHILVVAKLLTEWPLWRDYLTEGVLFCPYPDPYLTMSDRARDETMLLVQPNTYLAGHLIDKHRSAFPDETVERIK